MIPAFFGSGELLGIQAVRFSINWRTWSSKEVMTYSVARFRGRETIIAEQVRKLREKFLNLRRSGEEGGTSEGRLRCRRGVKNNRLWTLSMNYLLYLDVNMEVKVFQKICTRERNRYWS